MRMQRLATLALAGACATALFTTLAAARDAAPVNINTASEKELQELPGVGEATAKKIVAGRPYGSVDDLAKAGISSSTIGKLRSSATVGGGSAAPAPATAAKSPAGKGTPSPAAKAVGPVDLNTASLKDLEELPGVGEATAKKIVAGRPYNSVDDLAKAGVSKSTIEKLRPGATVSASAAARPAPASAPPATAASKTGTTATKAAGPVDLNTASVKDLEELPGVGEATAKKIVAGRPYASVDDLAKAGVSKSTIEKLRSGATVSGAPASRAPAPSTAAAPAANAPAAAAPVSKPPAPTAAPAAATSPPPAAPGSPAPAASGTAAPSAVASSHAAEAGKVAPGEMVNINTASKEDLMRLPGIGPTKAQAIIDTRPFSTPADIMKVKGIKEATFGKLKDNITVN
jgi:competence protein ComEA